MSSMLQTTESDAIVTPPSTPPTPNANALADIFSDSPPGSPSVRQHHADPSDIPRLRSQHTTAGYRDGVSAAKDKFLQPGFDEGYSLGATFGLKVGQLFGKLEGLALAKKIMPVRAEGPDARLVKMLAEMKQELALENLFGRKYWGEDGIWKYNIKGEGEGSAGSEFTFQGIVDSHPLVVKWDEALEREMDLASIKRGRFEGADWEAGRID